MIAHWVTLGDWVGVLKIYGAHSCVSKRPANDLFPLISTCHSCSRTYDDKLRICTVQTWYMVLLWCQAELYLIKVHGVWLNHLRVYGPLFLAHPSDLHCSPFIIMRLWKHPTDTTPLTPSAFFRWRWPFLMDVFLMPLRCWCCSWWWWWWWWRWWWCWWWWRCWWSWQLWWQLWWWWSWWWWWWFPPYTQILMSTITWIHFQGLPIKADTSPIRHSLL